MNSLKLMFSCAVCLFLKQECKAQDKRPPKAPKVSGNLGTFIYPPISALPPGDPLEDFANSFNKGGRLIYLISLVEGNHSDWFFVFRDEFSETQGALPPTLAPPVTTYASFSANFFADPQFSPDLQTLMYQSGDYITTHGFHVPCFWNFKTGQIRERTNTAINFPEVRFSPDSQYIGFYSGGDRHGHWDTPQDAPHLYAQNIRTGQSTLISTSGGITTWAWTTKGTLLYSQFLTSPTAGTYDSEIREHILGSVTAPDKIVLPHAQQPSPSPDNRFIAFAQCFEDKSAIDRKTATAHHTPNHLAQTRLCVYNTSTRQIIPLEAASPVQTGARDPICTWSQDSQMLVVTRFTDTINGQHCSIKSTTLDQISMATPANLDQIWKSVAEFEIPRHWPQGVLLSVQVKKLTRNKRYLVLSVTDYSRLDKNPTLETLEAVDLANGQVRLLAHKPASLNTSIGWDWVELPTDAKAH